MILVFGQSGQVAHELQSFEGIFAVDRSQADLCNPDQVADIIRDYKPAAVINAAAYTAVDKAEKEEALATVINCDAPSRMAEACANLSVPFVHISTDYVFDGSGNNAWLPHSKTNPPGISGNQLFMATLETSTSIETSLIGPIQRSLAKLSNSSNLTITF